MNSQTQEAPRRQDVRADRRRLARFTAYLGCAGAIGYGALKAVWAAGGTLGLRDPAQFSVAPRSITGPARVFDYWGTPVLAGIAVVILLGLVYPWGQRPIVRPLLRTLAWAGTAVAVWGVAGLGLMVAYYAGHVGSDRLGAIAPATFVFVYVCFLVLGVGFGVTAWLTRGRTTPRDEGGSR